MDGGGCQIDHAVIFCIDGGEENPFPQFLFLFVGFLMLFCGLWHLLLSGQSVCTKQKVKYNRYSKDVCACIQ